MSVSVLKRRKEIKYKRPLDVRIQCTTYWNYLCTGREHIQCKLSSKNIHISMLFAAILERTSMKWN